MLFGTKLRKISTVGLSKYYLIQKLCMSVYGSIQKTARMYFLGNFSLEFCLMDLVDGKVYGKDLGSIFYERNISKCSRVIQNSVFNV